MAASANAALLKESVPFASKFKSFLEELVAKPMDESFDATALALCADVKSQSHRLMQLCAWVSDPDKARAEYRLADSMCSTIPPFNVRTQIRKLSERLEGHKTLDKSETKAFMDLKMTPVRDAWAVVFTPNTKNVLIGLLPSLTGEIIDRSLANIDIISEQDSGGLNILRSPCSCLWNRWLCCCMDTLSCV